MVIPQGNGHIASNLILERIVASDQSRNGVAFP